MRVMMSWRKIAFPAMVRVPNSARGRMGIWRARRACGSRLL